MDTPTRTFSTERVQSLLLALSVGLAAFLIIFSTIDDYGYTWDEADINFPAARRQATFFQKVFSGEACLNEATVREYFETESDHPSLPRTFMAFGRLLAPSWIPDRVAFAWPTGLICAVFHSVFIVILSRRTGMIPSLVGSLVLLFHPRWFGHTHFAEYDILIAIAWFFAAISFWKAFEVFNEDNQVDFWKRSGWLALSTGLFGLALATKLHAFFLPFPLLGWALIFRKKGILPWCSLACLMGPSVYFLTQPYLWWHTWERLAQRFIDYGSKVPIAVFYLGEWYPGTTPWHYPWLLLWATLPAGFLLLCMGGLVGGVRYLRMEENGSHRRKEWFVFVLFNVATIPLLFSFKSAYDGIRFFLPSLPFIAILAAEGYRCCAGWLQRHTRIPCPIYLCPILAGLVMASQIITCYQLHPCQLAYYSLTIGGIRGAHQLGLESTYWCDAITPGFIEELAQKIPPDARISTHAMDAAPLREFQHAGQAPTGWRFVKEGPVDCRILQFRQGFFGPQEMRLVSEREPLVESKADGIPLAAAFPGP